MIILSYLSYYCIQLLSLTKTLSRVLDITKNCPFGTVFSSHKIVLVVCAKTYAVFLYSFESCTLSITHGLVSFTSRIVAIVTICSEYNS